MTWKVQTVRTTSRFPLWQQPATLKELYSRAEAYHGQTPIFEDLQSKINKAIENSPAKDIEKNVKAMLSQGFSKLDLVTREEFDIQAQVLAKTRAKLEALEARVTELEARQKPE